MHKTCLKCGHAHAFAEDLPTHACPNCGAIYAKVEQALKNTQQLQASVIAVEPARTSEPRPVNSLLWLALLGCIVLASASAILGTLYYQEKHLNQVLLSQRDLTPAAPISNPAPAIRADAFVPTGSELQLSKSRPPANLAENAEVIVISGYEAANQASQGTRVNVSIDRPGKAVLLVLSSYEKIAWQVDASADTQVKGILVSGYERPSVHSSFATQAFLSQLPYSYEKDSGNFVALLKGLHDLFGIQQVDAFRGEYALPNAITVSEPDQPQQDLTLAGDLPQAPLKPLQFELDTGDYGKSQWSLEGPVEPELQVAIASGKAVKAMQDQRIYQIDNHQLHVIDPQTRQKTQLEMPSNFPNLSWPMDVAYDSKRHYVTLASLGGEGFLYRFDTNTRQWLDFRSLDNIDVSSLAYDELADRYAAWTSDGSLLFIASDGTPLSSTRLADRLQGFNRLYDRGNGQPPSLLLVPRGEQLALIKLQGQVVDCIWYYDLRLDLTQLTYKRGSPLSMQ